MRGQGGNIQMQVATRTRKTSGCKTHAPSMTVVRVAAKDSQGRLLVVKRSAQDRFAGVWELPGGKTDKGESPQVSAAREFFEETGLELNNPLKLVGRKKRVTPKGKVFQELRYETVVEGSIQLSDEHDDFLWVDDSSQIPGSMTEALQAYTKA